MISATLNLAVDHARVLGLGNIPPIVLDLYGSIPPIEAAAISTIQTVLSMAKTLTTSSSFILSY